MKKHLVFTLLLILAAFFTTTFLQAQIQPENRILKLHDELMNTHFQAFNKNDGRMDFEKFLSQNTENQQNLPDLIFRANHLKNTKNSDVLIYEYDSIFFYKTSGNFLREFATRDASGKPLTEITQEWLPGNNFWRNSSKYTYTYDVSGNLVSGIFQTWSDGNNVWVDYEKVDMTYDASGNKLSSLYQLWETGSNTWVNSSKDSFTYDVTGNMITEINQDWDIANNTWLNFIKCDFSYNSSGNVLSEVHQNWETATNTWVNGVKISLTYDGSENLLVYLIQYWDIAGNIWVNDFQGLYTHDDAGNVTSVTSQFWDVASSVWINTWNHLLTYDAYGNRLTDLVQLWNETSGAWGNYSYFSYTWDGSYNLLSEVVQGWDAGGSSWLNNSKCEFQYDYENEKFLATYYEWNQVWVPADGTININLFGNNLYWGYEIHKIEFYYSTYTLGIEDNADKGNNAFEVYPNPAGNTINITFNTPSTVSGTIMLFNQFGKLVKEVPTGNLSSGKNTLTMDVSSLATGIYLLKFRNDGLYQTQKLVITR